MAVERIRYVGVAGCIGWFLAAASAPSPLYVLYQREWHFSPATLTLVFAVYAAAVLAALLLLGDLSDGLGRRPVLAGATLLEGAALLLFQFATGAVWLALARAIQGLATGMALPALAAALVDLEPRGARLGAALLAATAPLGGLAAGALGSGALITLAPSPTHAVYLVLLAGTPMVLSLIATLPRAARPRRQPWRPRPRRLAGTAENRGTILRVLPAFVGAWMLSGLYLSLGPSVAAGVFGVRSHLVGGLLVTAFCGAGAAGEVRMHRAPDMRIIRTGAALLALGTGMTLGAVLVRQPDLAAVGAVLSGCGFGTAHFGGLRSAVRLAPPHGRSGSLSLMFAVSYVAFGLPSVVAGMLATVATLTSVVVSFGGVVVATSLYALVRSAAAPPSGPGSRCSGGSLRALSRRRRDCAASAPAPSHHTHRTAPADTGSDHAAAQSPRFSTPSPDHKEHTWH